MAKFIFLLLGFFNTNFSNAAKIVYKENLKPELRPVVKTGSNLRGDLILFMKLRPDKYKKITGKKLSVKEMISLKIIQIRIKKSLRKGDLSLLNASQNKPRKKPKLLVALLIVLGIAILFFSIMFLIFSGVEW